MTVHFRKSFSRDLKRIRDSNVLENVKKVIEEAEAAPNPTNISNLKKISGSRDFYRIRIGEYRIGIVIDANDNDLEFVRCLHRREVYRYFP